LFACIFVTGWAAEVEAPDAVLLDVAQQYSPRVTWTAPRTIVLDLAGLQQLFGEARTIGDALRAALADCGLHAHVALAGTQTAARLLALGRAGLTVVAPGEERVTLAPLPLDLLARVEGTPALPRDIPRGATRFYRSSPMQEMVRPRRRAPKPTDDPRPSDQPRSSNSEPNLDPRTPNPELADALVTFRRWGLRTLGDLAALPSSELAARLGTLGPYLQALARGEDVAPLVPHVPDERFEATLVLEWPIEGLEPLSFVVSRLADPVCAHLDRRGRAAAVLHVDLRLITRETWSRRLELPAPMKDPRVLRTLAMLDLESHPPPAAIDAVTVWVEPTPARTLQHSLLERARPAPEQVSTLVARLSALMGERRVGRPELIDTHRPGAFRMAAFTGEDTPEIAGAPDATAEAPPTTTPALRRFRHPVIAEVSLADGRPVRVVVSRPGVHGGRVVSSAGPWRTSGDWWADDVWDHDEWDVGFDYGIVCRLTRDRRKDRWYVEGLYD
jgi:protein ImuB